MDLKIEPQTVQTQTANKLRDAILSGHFQPGQRLVETELCELMQVSRTSIREALRRLEGERLVTVVPNRGPFVAEITWEEATEIYDVRALLEGEAATLLAKRATAEMKRDMAKALADFVQANDANDAMGRLTATTRFYDVMLRGCGNRVIGELLQDLMARINFLRARSMSRPGRGRYSAAEMRRILRAIDKRDAAGARAAAVEHVRSACTAAQSVFELRKAVRAAASQ